MHMHPHTDTYKYTIICCIGKYGLENGEMVEYIHMGSTSVLQVCKALQEVLVVGSAQ
jgi:hypothetical protein